MKVQKYGTLNHDKDPKALKMNPPGNTQTLLTGVDINKTVTTDLANKKCEIASSSSLPNNFQ